MTYFNCNTLQWSDKAVIMHARATPAAIMLLCLIAQSAMAQDKPAPKPDDLDVTMQIITDPDAKLPDEVVRQIPLPARKPPAASATKAADTATDKGQEGRDAREMARDARERSKEMARDAAEQREQASRSRADERRRNPPQNPPPRPPRP